MQLFARAICLLSTAALASCAGTVERPVTYGAQALKDCEQVVHRDVAADRETDLRCAYVLDVWSP